MTTNLEETVYKRHTHSKLSSSDIGEVISEADRFLKKLRIKYLNQIKYIYLEGVRDNMGVLGTVKRLLCKCEDVHKQNKMKYRDDTYPFRGGVCTDSSSSMEIALNKQYYQLHEACHNHKTTTHLLALLTLTTLLASSSLDISMLMSSVS
jgi:hypothetical protein